MVFLARIIDDRFHVALNKLTSAQLPLKTAFKLKGISKSIKEEYAKYDELRQVALLKHGLKNENGELCLDDKGNVKFSGEGLSSFAKDIQELSGVAIEVPTVKLSELGDINITATDLELLDGIIVED